MNVPAVARRLGQFGNVMLSLALFTVLISFPASLFFFCFGWALYGTSVLVNDAATPSDPAVDIVA